MRLPRFGHTILVSRDVQGIIAMIERRRLWLRGLLVSGVLGLVLLLAIGRWAMPALAETVISRAIESGNFTSTEFRVSSVGSKRIHLAEVTLAAPGWRLQVPGITAEYGWRDLWQTRVRKVHVKAATLTLDLDAVLSAERPESPEAMRTGVLPFDTLRVDAIDLVVRQSGKERRLAGAMTLTGGFSRGGAAWAARLGQGETLIEARGTLDATRRVSGVSAQGTIAELGGWLEDAGIESPVSGIALSAIESSLIAVEGDWSRAGLFRVTAQTDRLAAQGEEAELELGDVQLRAEGINAEGTIQTSGRIERGARRSWEIQEGEVSWRVDWRPGETEHRLDVKETRGIHGESFSSRITATLMASGKGWKGNAALTDPQWFGINLEAIEATLERSGNEHSLVRIPMLSMAGWSGASLRDIAAEVTEDRFSVEAQQVMRDDQGEVTGRVPVTIAGVRGEDGWAVHLHAETVPDERWQASWRGLRFSLSGSLRADWHSPEAPIELRLSLPTADLRRNESVVALHGLMVGGDFLFAERGMRLALAGESAGHEFKGSVIGSFDEDGGKLDYQVENLALPENTLLSAVSRVFEDLTMAATVEGAGKLHLPVDGEKQHRLTLDVARGGFHHRERELEGTGIAGNVAIESFSPFVTESGQRAAFARLRLGKLQLTDGAFRYKLGPEGKVLITEAAAAGIGGRLKMESFSYDPAQPDFETAVTFQNIRLEKLAELFPGFEGNVGGRVSGKIHLRFEDDLLSLPQGSLSLDGGSRAYLRLDAKKVLGAQLTEMSDDPNALQTVEEALKDLVVDDLSIVFFDPEASESVCRIRIKGRSREKVTIPETGGAKAIAPIHLNINVDDPSELVRRLLDFGLRRQF